MNKKTPTKLCNRLGQKQRVAAVLIVVVIAGFLTFRLKSPERSVAAYCKVYKQETTVLGGKGGDTYTYSTTVFPNASSNNPEDFVKAFSNLDRVAPTSIESEVKAMKDVFVTINSNPSQTMSASLSGLSAESAVTQWTQENCNKTP